jgi:hypothetical protein
MVHLGSFVHGGLGELFSFSPEDFIATHDGAAFVH